MDAAWKRTLGSLMVLSACTIEPPNGDAGTSGREPGAPFDTNSCFACTLQACSVSTRACLGDAFCSSWLGCVGDCPTASNGVSAEADCVIACGLPVSAQVLYGCIQDYANGAFSGCEAACQPLPRDASVRD